MPTETADVQIAMHQMTGASRAKITPQAARESYLREIQPGQSVARPDHITPSEWMWAVAPLVKHGYLEAIGTGKEVLAVVRRTEKPDMPTHSSAIRAMAGKATMSRVNANGRPTT
jgi:hypothetical protein